VGRGGKRSWRAMLALAPVLAFARMLLLAPVLASALLGCERVEYIHRPAFYAEASGRPLEETWVKPDGTRVVVSDKRREGDGPKVLQFMRVEIMDETDEQREAREKQEEEEGIRELTAREELDDGTLILRAWTPDQVLAHLMTCLRNEEYDALYVHMLDPEVRSRWESTQGGVVGWRTYCETNRRDLMAMLNRMSFSLLGGDVVIEKTGPSRLRTRFSPRLERQFKFRSVEMHYTAEGLKLVAIRE